MTHPVETLVVGGGISGLACARTLHDAGHPFLLVTDRLGGRMFHSADGAMNFGATYVNADYHHVLGYVGRGQPFCLRQVYGHTGERPVSFLHWRNLPSWRPLARLVGCLRQFRLVLRAFRKDSEHTPQYLLPRYHPLIDRYRRQPAAELVHQIGLGSLHDDYATLAYQATCFASPIGANALFYLSSLLPIVTPMWVADFTHTYDRLTAGYHDRILLDRVTGLKRSASGRWEVHTGQGRQWQVRNVVLAIPPHNLAGLYPVPPTGPAVTATILHTQGGHRPPYHSKGFLLLPPQETGLALLWRLRRGTDLVFSLRPQPDLRTVYDRVRVLASVTWKTAIILSGASWLPLVLEPGLFLASDHNLSGLEDSFLSGRCAAHHILHPTANVCPS
jgi:glycine/D-amino acid oxidase-like deaminating enzyme